MLNRISGLFAAAVLASASADALAQQGTIGGSPSGAATPSVTFRTDYESRYKYNFQDKPQQAQVQARAIADCLVKRGKGKAGELLGGTESDPNFQKLQKALTGKFSACNPEGAAGVPMVAINTALAEQIIRSENRSFAAHVSPADVNAAKAFYASANGVTMDSLGRCLAVYSPGLVDSLLSTAAGSETEKKALATLYAETPECGVRSSPAGIPADEQRNALANGLYSWLHRG